MFKPNGWVHQFGVSFSASPCDLTDSIVGWNKISLIIVVVSLSMTSNARVLVWIFYSPWESF